MRLDRYLAEGGAGTRSEVKKLIAAGRVRVNGAAVKDAGLQIKESSDAVTLDGEPVVYAAFEYFLLNKPQGVISASRLTGDLKDKAAVCVTDLITDRIRDDLFPVGRLDKDTEGLLLITNDGALSHRLLSPKKHVDKTYYAELDGELSPSDAEEIMAGVDIGDDKPTLPCEISILTGDGSVAGTARDQWRTGTVSACEITIREGRYHQIKRMFMTKGLTVTFLKRLTMGPLSLDPDLAPGEYRRLTEEELKELQAAR